MAVRWRWAGLPIALGLFVLAALWNLDGPPMWWDEGWTLSVARTIVERGVYARLLDGNLAPHGLEAAVPFTEMVALSFRLFGIGIWQGRLPSVLCAALALGALWAVARRAFDTRTAWGALAAALLLAPHPQLHALVQGRQVLAELPMLAALLGGIVCADAAGRGRWWAAVPATALWMLALALKAQTQPFLAAGLATGVLMALLLRRWRYAVVLAGSGVVAMLLLRPFAALLGQLSNQQFQAGSVSGLIEIIALVTESGNRRFALVIWAAFGLLTTLGLLYCAWKLLREWRAADRDPDRLALRALLLGVAGSWMAWFVALSVGAPRYMFPPVFLGAVFTSKLLSDLTGGFDARLTLRRLTAPLRERNAWRACAAAWLAIVLLAAAVPLTALSVYRYYLVYDDRAAFAVATFFNTSTPAHTRIETYESELHFLLDRPYHYPPDQVHVELNRRSLLGRATAIDYDPLASDPDYLVVGVFARGNDLYAPAIAAGHFRLLQQIGEYEIYERVR
jgi:hypothetical protein